MSPTAEDDLAVRVIDAVRSGLKGDQQRFVDLAREYASSPNMLAVISMGAVTALLNVVSKQRGRIKALESRPVLKYMGVYTGSVQYEAGSIVTHGGSMFHCNVEGTSDRPGTSGAWTMCVKSGKDGRDRDRKDDR
jgi:hypothetical protein